MVLCRVQTRRRSGLWLGRQILLVRYFVFVNEESLLKPPTLYLLRVVENTQWLYNGVEDIFLRKLVQVKTLFIFGISNIRHPGLD